MLAYIRPIGRDGLVVIVPVESAGDPGFGQDGGMRPDQGLPGGGGHPWLPGHGDGGLRPDQGLPGSPGHPDNRPPSQPPQVQPGSTLVLVRSGDGKWHYASIEPGSPPPKPVPVPPLPPHVSGQPIPGGGQPHPSPGPVPPQPTPSPTGR